MRIHHVMVNGPDVGHLASFFRLLVSCHSNVFIDSTTGRQGLALSFTDSTGAPTAIVLVPAPEKSMPCPQHLAFELDTDEEFERAYCNMISLGRQVRSGPKSDSEPGIGSMKVGQAIYRQFYVTAPNGTNVEVMRFERAVDKSTR